MDKNILEVIKVKKQIMKLSAVAFVGAIAVFGISHAASAMKPSTKSKGKNLGSGVSMFAPVSAQEELDPASFVVTPYVELDSMPIVIAEKCRRIITWRENSVNTLDQSQYNLGMELYQGGSEDFPPALEAFEAAASRGSVPAKLFLEKLDKDKQSEVSNKK